MKKIVLSMLICSTIMGSSFQNVTYAQELDYIEAQKTVESLTISPRYIDLTTISANLSISSSGTATCVGTAKARSKTSYIKAKVILYKKVGSTWKEVSSWSETGSSGKSITLSKKQSGLVSGYSYKVKVIIDVYDSKTGAYIEGDVIESNIVKY